MDKWNLLTPGQEFIPEEEMCSRWMWILFREGWNQAAIAASGYPFRGKIEHFVLASENQSYGSVDVKDVKAWMPIIQPDGPPETPWHLTEEDEDANE
jgi:hypothetical protein